MAARHAAVIRTVLDFFVDTVETFLVPCYRCQFSADTPGELICAIVVCRKTDYGELRDPEWDMQQKGSLRNLWPTVMGTGDGVKLFIGLRGGNGGRDVF